MEQLRGGGGCGGLALGRTVGLQHGPLRQRLQRRPQAQAELRREAESSLAAERELTICERERAARLEAEAAELTRQLKQARQGWVG